ncbi:hypothetical protein [Piscinibacter sp.]|jgi:hypothetical protein|uniref:hypothetical protein n=1 Tax=Piscinibacter sp. TaxID=1903157 RepID=UPI0035595C98
MDVNTLAGRLRLWPGRAVPTIDSTRPDAAARLAPGRRASELPALLGALFTLCSHAHRFTAQRAVDAALGRPATVSADERRALQAATARDQVLRLTHDWPRQLPGARPAEDAANVLRSCPLWRDDLAIAERLDALPAWIEHKWLGMAAQDWIAHWANNPLQWPARWCSAAGGRIAPLLRAQLERAQRLPTPAAPLGLLTDPQRSLPALACLMAGTPRFCAEPLWRGEAAETGPWTRHLDPVRPPAHNAWMRLVSRVVEVVRLALPGGEHWLSHGALTLGAHEGIAWTEMARGLLVHWVQLEPVAEGARVAACRVLAPTEWNFHPRGVLARALAALPEGPQRDDDARCLAVAFDPCVEFEIVPATAPTPEAAHA